MHTFIHEKKSLHGNIHILSYSKYIMYYEDEWSGYCYDNNKCSFQGHSWFFLILI